MRKLVAASAIALGLAGFVVMLYSAMRPPSTVDNGRKSGDLGIGPVLPPLNTGGSFSGVTLGTGAGLTGTGTAGSPISVNVGNDYASKHLEWITEFLGSPTTTSPIEPYTVSVSGGSIAANAAAGRPGIWQLATSTVATNRASLLTNGNVADFGSGSWVFEWTGCVDTLSSGTDGFSVGVGFLDTAAIDQVDGCYFLYDERNAAAGGVNASNLQKLECWCSSNSVRTAFLMDGSTVSNESFTTVNAPVAACTLPNTNMLTLKVLMTGTTRAEFFVNGVKSCDINTNIPSGATRATGAGAQIIKSVGTTNRTVEMDRARLAVDLTSARSP